MKKYFYLLIFLLPITIAWTASSPAQASGTWTNLGQPITNTINQDSSIGIENGRPVEYMVVKGANDSTFFAAVDILDNKLCKRIPLPGVTGAWGVETASDGRVYIGTHYDGRLLQYTPGADEVKTIAKLGDESHVFDIVAGKNGKVYIGTYPHAHVFEYDPATDQLRDYGSLSKTEKYVRCVAYDGDHDMIYAGVGGKVGTLVQINAKTGEHRDILSRLFKGNPPKTGMPRDMSYAKGKLFVKYWPLLIIDVATMTVEHYMPKDSNGEVIGMGGKTVFTNPDDPDHVYFGADTLYRYNINDHTFSKFAPFMEFQDARIMHLPGADYPGLTLVATCEKGHNALLNLPAKRLVHFDPKPDLGGPVLIQSLSTGFDGAIYIGGYLGDSGFSSYLPDKSTFTPVRQFGQSESVASVGKKLYIGNYPAAFIWEYDPALPWNDSNPHLVMRLDRGYKQDRPFALLGVDELGKLFVGSVPGYTHHQGALTIYDVATQKSETFMDIVKDEGIVSLAYSNGLIYGGTTIDGGLGTKGPVEKSGKFFVFDPHTKKKVLELIPNPGARSVTGLLTGPDGQIWGVADAMLFKYDPATRHIVYAKKYFGKLSKTVWANASLKTGKDGFVYGANRDQLFFKVNPQTMELTVIKEKAGHYLAEDDDGNFYLANDSYLWKYEP